MSLDFLDKVKQSWLDDDELKKLIQELCLDKSSYIQFVWQNNQLKWKGKLVVGKNSKLGHELLEYYHKSVVGGHSGVHATTKRLSQVFLLEGDEKGS